MIKIGITGHRNLLYPNQVASEIRLSLEYFKALTNYTEENPTLVCISALASGADLLFAEEAIRQGIRLNAMIPFNLDEYKKDFTAADIKRLNNILEKSSSIIVQEATVQTQQQRNEAYLQNGKKLVDVSDAIIAVWNKKPAAGMGGTADIVTYAKSKDRQLYIIEAKRNDERNAFAGDVIQDKFDLLDKKAVTYKKHRFESAWISGIICGLLAVLSFAIKQSFIETLTTSVVFLLSVSEITFLFLSFILLTVFAKRWKNFFLLNRRNAEHLRTLLWYRNAGIPIPEIEFDDEHLDKEILVIEKEMGNAIQKTGNLNNAKRMIWSLAQAQAEYHERVRIKPFEKKLKRMDVWLQIIKVIFFVVSPLSFIFDAIGYFYPGNNITRNIPHSLLLFVGLVLPSFYAALEGIKYFGEWKRNIAVSKKMVKELEKAKKRILDCSTENALATESRLLRETLENENIDWTARFDEKEVGAVP